MEHLYEHGLCAVGAEALAADYRKMGGNAHREMTVWEQEPGDAPRTV